MGAMETTGELDGRRAQAKRAHDVTSALRTLRFLTENLEAGYRFDDAAAAGKIAAVRRAVAVLERESLEWIAHIQKSP